jgi:hypothetical protein
VSPETRPLPSRMPTLYNGDSHIVCCRPELALCGDVLNGEFIDDDEAIDCADCVVADESGQPCGAPLCRLRGWWLSW